MRIPSLERPSPRSERTPIVTVPRAAPPVPVTVAVDVWVTAGRVVVTVVAAPETVCVVVDFEVEVTA